MGPPKVEVAVARLMAKAETVAGADGWGDLGFVDTLELLVGSCARSAALSPAGERVLERVVVRHLVNRLLINAHVEAHPEVMSRSLGAAVVVTGMPRTGTTLLHNLLAIDPASRVLRFWEALRPVPPDSAGPHSEPELVHQAARWLERLYELIPSFRAVHAATPEGPEECDALLQNEFASQHFEDMFNAEDYSDWLAHAGLNREYSSYAKQLRILTRPQDAGRTWTLKSPSHLGHLDALIEAYPGAVVVQCHRRPDEAVPSYASLVLTLRTAYSDNVSAGVIGRQALGRCEIAMQRALEVRRAHPERFVDVSYSRLVHDPLGSVRTLYRSLGGELTPGLEEAMQQWLAANVQHRHGVHRYSLEQFGLSRSQVSAAFEDYAGQFAGEF